MEMVCYSRPNKVQLMNQREVRPRTGDPFTLGHGFTVVLTSGEKR